MDGYDADDIELLDDLISAASLNLETPERLRRNPRTLTPPYYSTQRNSREEVRLKSASSGFSVWTTSELPDNDRKSIKKD